jgi:hypothetical protein
MKRIMKNTLAGILSVIMLVSQMACGGPLSNLNDALDLAPGFIDVVVASGAISAAQGETYKSDLTESRTNISTAKSELAAIPATAPNKSVLQAQVYVNLVNKERLIFARNHWQRANSPKIALVVTLINSTLTLINNHYNQPEGLRGASNADYEKQLDSKVDELKRVLKAK